MTAPPLPAIAPPRPVFPLTPAKSRMESKVQTSLAQRRYGRTMVQQLERLGLLSPRLSCAHTIWIDSLANSEEITPEKWRSRPFEDRVKEMAAKAWSQLL